MRKLRALDSAQAEYLDTLRYYRKIDRDLARGFRSEFREQLEHVRQFPEAVPRLPRTPGFHVRRFLLDRFEYAVVFALFDDELVIVAVHHQHRKPGYWKPRLAKVRP